MHPVSHENGDPGSPFPYEMRDPGPQFSNILGTLGSPILYDIRDPSMKSGTPMELFCLAKFLHHHAMNNVGHFQFQLTCTLEEQNTIMSGLVQPTLFICSKL